MASILVTGANGQLGRELRDLASSFPQHHFFFTDREMLNIVDERSIAQAFSSLMPQYCINCAAYTAVDKAETEREQAFAINATAVKKLAAACKKNGTKFIHISTDYVFDGTANTPYKEDNATNPINLYGESKRRGEEALHACPEALIIRTSWVYSAYGNNFVKTMLRLMQSRSEINVVNDQQGSPTYAADLAKAMLQIIDSQKWQGGIYHYTNEGNITWFEFATAIRELTNANCVVHPISTGQYPTPAKRPRYSVLNKEKIVHTFGLTLLPWQESLQTCLHKLHALPH